MINKKLQLVLSLTFMSALNAQDVFKVLAAKGSGTVKSGSATEWKKALIGMKIQQADAIKLNANDYLGLMHIASGKTLELKTAGSYNVKDLAAKVSATGSTYSQKYAEYVMSAMSNNGTDANKNVGGVVYRDVHDVELDYPASQQIVITSRTFDVAWHKNPNISTYLLVVQNMFDETVFSLSTTDTMAKVDLSKADLGDDNRLKLKVKAKKDSEVKFGDKEVSFVIDESKDFAKRKEEFLNEVKEETALNYLIKAKFFESNNMFVDAVDSYDKAIKLEPKIEEFKEMKVAYLQSTGAVKAPDAKTGK